MNSVKKIKEWLNTFTPFNEQEQVDCQRIRQILEEEENLLLPDNVKMNFTSKMRIFYCVIMKKCI